METSRAVYEGAVRGYLDAETFDEREFWDEQYELAHLAHWRHKMAYSQHVYDRACQPRWLPPAVRS